ncbi:hypothetical protein pdam_00022315 [Pocillopora damicornis]|uniref:G-protein coupled receptors family 1 profile domain-containing protein n=1 Tax=Pocillopora damicornis TaxID=46731 RepID=A0A3M6TZ42_POCDA|nr:hypothetical protein pdam_00022315 [Pocillopora damicornis]
MTMSNNEDSLINSSKAVFFCPRDPLFVWDLENEVSLQLVIAITAIAAPFTTFLNTLLVVTIKKTKELQTNSNILITRLAITDLLVGAVSTPLNITKQAIQESCTKIAKIPNAFEKSVSGSFYKMASRFFCACR